MRNAVPLYILLLISLAVSSGCSTPVEPATSTPEPTPTATEVVPTATPTPPPPRAGKEVYDQECLSCHRLDDVDTMGPGLAGLLEKTSLSDGKPVSDQGLADLIARGTEGAGAMPAIRLTQSEMEAVIAYMKEVLQ